MLSLLGTFELHVTAGNTLRNSSTLCRTFNFSGIKQYQAAIECENAIRGDTIVVKKMDEGALRLFELLPISLCIKLSVKKMLLNYSMTNNKSNNFKVPTY